MRLKHLILSSTLALSLNLCANAQRQDATESGPNNQQAGQQQAAEKQALKLLDAVIEEANALRLPENRAWMQANVASLLWSHAEERARNLFKEALTGLDDYAESLDSNDPQSDSFKHLYAAMREDILRLLAQHDLPLARDFLRRTKDGSQTEEQLQFGLELATQVATKNPEQAVKLAQESLSKKVSYQLSELVSQLQEKDHAAASTLVGDILLRLRSEDLAANEEAATVASDLLRLATKPPEVTSGAIRRQSPPLINQQERQELIEMIARAALRPSSNNLNLLLSLRPVLQELDRYAPSLAMRIRPKVMALSLPSNGQGDADETHRIGMGDEILDDIDRPTVNEEPSGELVKQAVERVTKGEDKLALQLLDEAGRLVNIGSRAKSSIQLSAQLKVLRAYGDIAPARGLSILEAMIDHLNELSDAVVVVDGFLTPAETPLARSDELIIQTIFQSLDEYEYSKTLASFTFADFEQTKRVADRFQRREVRILARFLVARSVLIQM